MNVSFQRVFALMYLYFGLIQCQKPPVKATAIECPDVVCTPIAEHCEIPRTFYMNKIPCEDCPGNNCDKTQVPPPCPTLMCDHDPFPLNCEQETYYINKDGIQCKGCPENGCLSGGGQSAAGGSASLNSSPSSQTSPATSPVLNSHSVGQASPQSAVMLQGSGVRFQTPRNVRRNGLMLLTTHRNRQTGRVFLRTRQPVVYRRLPNAARPGSVNVPNMHPTPRLSSSTRTQQRPSQNSQSSSTLPRNNMSTARVPLSQNMWWPWAYPQPRMVQPRNQMSGSVPWSHLYLPREGMLSLYYALNMGYYMLPYF